MDIFLLWGKSQIDQPSSDFRYYLLNAGMVGLVLADLKGNSEVIFLIAQRSAKDTDITNYGRSRFVKILMRIRSLNVDQV